MAKRLLFHNPQGYSLYAFALVVDLTRFEHVMCAEFNGTMCFLLVIALWLGCCEWLLAASILYKISIRFCSLSKQMWLHSVFLLSARQNSQVLLISDSTSPPDTGLVLKVDTCGNM